MQRRDFLGLMAVGTLGAVTLPAWLQFVEPEPAHAASLIPVPVDTSLKGKRVVVVGGGMAGAAAAKYLRLWGGSGLAVTLIEQAPSYTSNIMSNMVVVGERTLSSLNYTYSNLKSWYGVTVVQGKVAAVNPAARSVTLANGTVYAGDALVLAPGLEFTGLPGHYDVNLTPHAWQAGPQTAQLASQLTALANGSDVIITVPKAPYRCPPGPYERACVMADWLRANRPNSKLYLLDANPGILVEQANFANAFAGKNTSGYTVTYRHDVAITDVDSAAKTITYTYLDDTGVSHAVTAQHAGVLNPIPPMQAPAMLRAAGLCTTNGANGMQYAPVQALTFESSLPTSATNAAPKYPGVHIVGDSSAVPAEWYPGYTGVPTVGIPGIPKAGHIGNQQGKTAASAIVRRLRGDTTLGAETDLVLNSACYTPITRGNATSPGTATWLSALYEYDPAARKMYATQGQPKAASSATTRNFSEMLVWFNTVMSDTFA
jgi:sulfide dehydrogenase [flavocytochrome c] flavoprotein chain